eukprot:TCONS_00068155-protein
MADIVPKGLSDLLNLKIVLTPSDPSINTGKPLPVLDLDSLHKYSLHWVSSDGNNNSAAAPSTSLPGQRNLATNAPPTGSPAQRGLATNIPTAQAAISGQRNLASKSPSVSNPGQSNASGDITLTVKTLTGKSTMVKVKPDSQISDVKDSIRSSDGLGLTQGLKLLHLNKNLKDEATLKDSFITENATLFMIISAETVAPAFYMNAETFLHPKYDYQYGAADKTQFSRGNRRFIRPCGWMKKALRVLGKYENNTWLGVAGRQSETQSAGGEWPVAYHGTKKGDVEKLCRERSRNPVHQGQNFTPGKGIYTTSSPHLAEQQSESFDFEGHKYKMIFMDRVDMSYTAEYKVPSGGQDTYFITSEERVRPYCILFKKV